jgi:hypothetical protein
LILLRMYLNDDEQGSHACEKPRGEPTNTASAVVSQREI